MLAFHHIKSCCVRDTRSLLWELVTMWKRQEGLFREVYFKRGLEEIPREQMNKT